VQAGFAGPLSRVRVLRDLCVLLGEASLCGLCGLCVENVDAIAT